MFFEFVDSGGVVRGSTSGDDAIVGLMLAGRMRRRSKTACAGDFGIPTALRLNSRLSRHCAYIRLAVRELIVASGTEVPFKDANSPWVRR